MKIKKKHVGQEFVYVGENTDSPLGKLTYHNKVKLVKVFGKELTDSDLCVVENEKGIWIFCNKQDLVRPIEWPPLFTGPMIKVMADKIVECHKDSGKVIFPNETIPRDTVEVSGPYGTFKAKIANEGDFDGMPSQTFTFGSKRKDNQELSVGDTVYFVGTDPEECKYISFGEECTYLANGNDADKVIVQTNRGRYITLRLSKESISKTNPGFFDAHIAKASKEIDERAMKASIDNGLSIPDDLKEYVNGIERQLYDVQYPDIHMEDNEETSTSIPLDQETADAIKAMVDRMVGKQLVDFGVGYASIDVTDESVNPKRLINSISIKVD